MIRFSFDLGSNSIGYSAVLVSSGLELPEVTSNKRVYSRKSASKSTGLGAFLTWRRYQGHKISYKCVATIQDDLHIFAIHHPASPQEPDDLLLDEELKSLCSDSVGEAADAGSGVASFTSRFRGSRPMRWPAS